MNFQVSSTQLIEMIRAQEVLNKKYSGLDWRKRVHLGMAKMALVEEMAEMGHEINATWKWWSPVEKHILDFSKATFEFIDVIHFALLLLLYRYSEEELCYALKDEMSNDLEPDMWGAVGDPHNAFIKSVTRFLTAIDIDNRRLAIKGVRNIIETGAVLLGLNDGDVLKAYMLKNERNHKRVEGGVMTGEYDKSKESDLKL
jgi:dimeric dUTPase (all-alpha-NTP-PPase superfamily)